MTNTMPDKPKGDKLTNALADVLNELAWARKHYPPMNSQHEGFAVIEEEFIELRNEVFAKRGTRNQQKVRREAVQVAAMGLRFLVDVCGFKEDGLAIQEANDRAMAYVSGTAKQGAQGCAKACDCEE